MSSSGSSLGKSLSIPPTHQISIPAGPSTSSFESSRRPSHISPSSAQPTPRKGQAQRKQHKNQRRPSGWDRESSNLYDFDAMAEFRSLGNPSSRRGQTSITHLLSYSSPRPARDQMSHTRSYRRGPAWGPGSGNHAADKARYVHANYRFVVSPEGSYARHAADADLSLDWSSVLQVIASSESQATSCPICLSDPVAPRMAKCGHIFCLSCLIRFMNSSPKDDEAKSNKGARWKKCPLCEDTIYLHEVRPVRFYSGQETALPQVGDDVILRLMARHANSTLALPRESGAEVLDSGDDIPWHFAANVVDYARIIKGTREYMDGQYDTEMEELMLQEKEDELLFGQDGEWSQRAIKAIQAAKERTAGLAALNGATSMPGSNPSKQASEADFYFYSALPHLYLSPLDIRILKSKYGSFASFPSTLLPRVEHISTGHVVDEALRKRARYLGHLPQGCVISFLECDWTDIVPADILDTFSEEIERRRKRNRDKSIQEERERLQAERLEAAALRGSLAMRRLAEPLDMDEAPRLDPSEFQPLSGHSGASPPDPRPGFETLASMSTSPTTQRTVWGTRVIPGSPELQAAPPPPTDDGWLKDEEFLGVAELAMQMEGLNAAEDELQKASAVENPPPSGGGGKKKKKQKITLMSTGGRRGN